MADVKRVYTFGNKEAEGNGKMRELLGGKGANLAEMNLIGIPVPPGFTITTEVCTEYYAHGKQAVIDLLRPDVEKAIQNIERLTDRKFGDKDKPLLVSVRSGARASMPGMMDTILNLGMNDQAVEAVSKLSGPALGSHLRRLRLVDERARHPLPQAQQHPRRVGYGRIGTGHGIRQHGQQLGYGRGLLARRRNG